MTLHLAPDIHATAFDDDLVLLDVRRGAYACLIGAAEGCEIACGASTLPLDPDGGAAAALHAAGYVAEGQSAVRRHAVLARSELRCPAADGRGRAAPWLGAAFDFARAYPGRSFASLLQTTRAGRAGNGLATPDLAADVRAFRGGLPWLPGSPQCLARCFLLLAGLRRAGHDPDWVFGVRTWPFEAHCWLQVGDVVLDDPLDHVRRFEPILVV